MFPCGRGHFNAGCDKSDNDLSPPRRAILGGVGWGEKQDMSLCFGLAGVVPVLKDF